VLRLLTACFVLLVAASFGSAPAAPPENADPALAPFFQSLKQPGTGASCCSIADCRPVDYRLAIDGYEAKLDGDWVHVPDHRILHGQTNPTARAILCRSPVNGSILCFVPASET
jgi:hypothetical protein